MKIIRKHLNKEIAGFDADFAAALAEVIAENIPGTSARMVRPLDGFAGGGGIELSLPEDVGRGVKEIIVVLRAAPRSDERKDN
ncbi:MAG: hypothetical protein LBL36_02070 [Clostridiales Family XIII bacterium]|jgi:hypothetical protein|nr:hypothetical protein [Clostridiales Family XIII bacterium]